MKVPSDKRSLLSPAANYSRQDFTIMTRYTTEYIPDHSTSLLKRYGRCRRRTVSRAYSKNFLTRKPCYCKDDRAMRPMLSVPLMSIHIVGLSSAGWSSPRHLYPKNSQCFPGSRWMAFRLRRAKALC